jgi:hypothetical protein
LKKVFSNFNAHLAVARTMQPTIAMAWTAATSQAQTFDAAQVKV